MSKVALVTGAGRNIGRSIAVALARDGFDIAVNVARSKAEGEAVVNEVRALGRNALLCVADVADPAQVQKMFADVKARWGALQVLVNNAAIRGEEALEDMTFERWRNVVSICLDGAFLCSQQAAKLFSEAQGGNIINVGGLTAHTGATHRAHVVAAKAGLVGLTRALADELACKGVRVNCVSPGLIDTVRNAASAPVSPRHHQTRTNFLKRHGSAEEVADVVAWLASPQSSYVTGQVIHANGGAYLGG
jgi:3-oxoacyl-[acyl-carrier protein] reductase